VSNLVLNEGYSSASIIIDKAYGCYLKDVDGCVYVDTTLGNGTHILGHSSKVVVDSIRNQIEEGILYTTFNKHTYKAAKLIQECNPDVIESVVFCNSGSEATMRAARISRAYTGKDKIAIFSGGWHGGNELYMYDYNYHANPEKVEHKSSGVPDAFKDSVIVLPYNSEKAFEIIEKNSDDIAMVIVEPAQGSNPRDDMLHFLQKLRNVTKSNKIILCFDEIITGFRVAIGGCSEYYNIQPDLVTYGKTLGAGLAVGVVAGSSKVMNTIQGNNNNLPVFMGGTFSANPLTMAVVESLIEYLIKHKKKIYDNLNSKGAYIRKIVNNYCVDHGVPLRMMGIGSMMRLIFSDHLIESRRDRDLSEADVTLQKKFYKNMLSNGIFVNNNGILFLSTEHSNDDIEKIISSIILSTPILTA
jgi:glutamate-1-semialdehyde 2,1-aminomutase